MHCSCGITPKDVLLATYRLMMQVIKLVYRLVMLLLGETGEFLYCASFVQNDVVMVGGTGHSNLQLYNLLDRKVKFYIIRIALPLWYFYFIT